MRSRVDRINKLLDTITVIVSYTPIVLYVYVYVLKNSIKCYKDCAVND